MYCMEASRVATIVPHIRPVGIIFLMAKVTVHKCAGIIRMWVLFKGGSEFF